LTRSAVLALVATAAASASGCGLGAGRGSSDVTVTVTRAFGAQRISQITQRRVPGAETVMRMLERAFRVTTRYGGGFVESINGLSGSPPRLDWFYYVNGIQAPVGAASTPVHRGDHIWWDLHDWTASASIPAVVGSFPEPFVHGSAGKRLPTTVQCAPALRVACQSVTRALASAGVPVASQLLGGGSGEASLGVLVGTWSELRGVIATRLVEQGPGSSGVYARFTNDGSALELLSPRGAVVRTLHSGAGLLAATAKGSASPTWLITGTDGRGVQAAAAAMTTARLRDRFALATTGSSDLPLPVEPTR
jgi:hypothetical protein